MMNASSFRGGRRHRLPLRPLVTAVLVAVASTRCAFAASPGCDIPAVGPVDVVVGAADKGRHVHIITGTVAVCDMAAPRAFAIALPDLRDIGAVSAQLALAGFVRRYGLHQIGFALSSVAATPGPKNVTVRYAATVDGLDRYQLAYTLYLTAGP